MINGLCAILMLIYCILVMRILVMQEGTATSRAALAILGIVVLLQVLVQNFKIQQTIRRILGILKK